MDGESWRPCEPCRDLGSDIGCKFCRPPALRDLGAIARSLGYVRPSRTPPATPGDAVAHHEYCASLQPGPQLGPPTKPCNCRPYASGTAVGAGTAGGHCSTCGYAGFVRKDTGKCRPCSGGPPSIHWREGAEAARAPSLEVAPPPGKGET